MRSLSSPFSLSTLNVISSNFNPAASTFTNKQSRLNSEDPNGFAHVGNIGTQISRNEVDSRSAQNKNRMIVLSSSKDISGIKSVRTGRNSSSICLTVDEFITPREKSIEKTARREVLNYPHESISSKAFQECFIRNGSYQYLTSLIDEFSVRFDQRLERIESNLDALYAITEVK